MKPLKERYACSLPIENQCRMLNANLCKGQNTTLSTYRFFIYILKCFFPHPIIHINSNIGFDFSGNEDLEYIRYAYEAVNISHHIWQGDGITNCLPRGTSRLREALWRRDQPGPTYVDKVYWWTVDRMSTMRAVLR